LKFGLWLLVALAAWLWFHQQKKQRLRADAERRQARQAGAQAGTAAPAHIEAMVGCAYCGLHVPASDAVGTGAGTGELFCCEAHRLQRRAS
jgi:uncharacterized protein